VKTSEWKPEHTDRLIEVLGWAVSLGTWAKDRQVKQRLSDVEVPRGIEMTTLLFLLSAKRQRQRQWDQTAESMEELGEILAKRAIESDKRQQQLVDLQASLEGIAQDGKVMQASMARYTRWLVILTVAVTVIGIASIAATIVVAATS
jgi:hypothetical protein